MNRDPSPRLAAHCRGVVKRYGALTAVDGLDLEVRRGQCLGLLGPNGAGKTTTVEMMEGLTAPDDGDLVVLGRRWGAGHDRELRQRLGVQLQETQLADKLTVAETVRLFRSFHRRGRSIDAVIDAVELNEKRHARVGRLSGGQRQRLAVACALVGDPELLFLDEPTTGLDPQARLKLWEIIEAFRAAGGTVLLTTHAMEEASRLCDRVAIMDRGRVIAEGTPAALVASLGADQVLELTTTGASPDPAVLRALPGVHDLAARSDRLTLHVADLGAALPALLAALERSGAHLRTMVTHQATLEDVFVHLTGKELRDG